MNLKIYGFLSSFCIIFFFNSLKCNKWNRKETSLSIFIRSSYTLQQSKTKKLILKLNKHNFINICLNLKKKKNFFEIIYFIVIVVVVVAEKKSHTERWKQIETRLFFLKVTVFSNLVVQGKRV